MHHTPRIPSIRAYASNTRTSDTPQQTESVRDSTQSAARATQMRQMSFCIIGCPVRPERSRHPPQATPLHVVTFVRLHPTNTRLDHVATAQTHAQPPTLRAGAPRSPIADTDQLHTSRCQRKRLHVGLRTCARIRTCRIGCVSGSAAPPRVWCVGGTLEGSLSLSISQDEGRCCSC
jgi:hypothetical protein